MCIAAEYRGPRGYARSMRTLYLIDGYAQFFRAYHAIRTPMTSPVTGEPTNMTFGFVGMLLKLLRAEGDAISGEAAPTHLAVALDVSGDFGTFRTELYPEYKATRPEPPEDLGPQIERALSTLEAMNVRTVGSEGFEADDVIATIVREIGERRDDVLVRIVSKDKDLKQLLEPGRVELYDVHTDELITAESMREGTGVDPERVADMLALMGDSIDNIPGVPGIGPKTAAQLIAEFGSLDAVLEEVRTERDKKDQRIKGKRRERIAESAGSLPLSRRLVTLRDDAPLEFDLDGARVDRIDLVALEPVLNELGFNRYRRELRELMGNGEGGDDGDDAASGRAVAASGDGPGLFEQDATPTDPSAAAAGAYACVVTREGLEAVVTRLGGASLIAIDTETTGRRAMRSELVGLSLAVEPGEAWYVPVRSPEPESHLDAETVLGMLRPILEDASIPKIGHNIKYDMLVLRRSGVRLRGIETGAPASTSAGGGGGAGGGGDTMVASALLDASRSSHAMDALALAQLGRTNTPITDLIGTGKKQRTFDEVPLDTAAPYAAEDADVTLQLAGVMHPELERRGLGRLYREVEVPLVGVLAELEWNGILVDPDELARQRGRLETEIERLKAEIADAAMESTGRGFDVDSPKQLASILFNQPGAAEPGLGIRPQRRTKTGYSTDAEVLTKLAEDPAVESPIPRLVLEYRRLAKLVGTYLVALGEEIHPETGRVHASFNQTVAATGRLSSSDPNLQNIPIRTELGREIRKAFVAPEGRSLITADYSQIELRVLAHLSGDRGLTEAFERGEDIHTAVAARVHGVEPGEVTREQRSGAKMVNFGIVYGITPFGLARRLGISNSEAEEIITGYKARFSGITTFLEECVAQAREHGHVETMLGRRRPITEIDARSPQRRSLAERMAINSVVQGSAADLIKLAMIDLHRRISAHDTDRADDADPVLSGVRMLLQIHDELVFEAPDGTAEAARALIAERMEEAYAMSVPLVVESGVSKDWYSAK